MWRFASLGILLLLLSGCACPSHVGQARCARCPGYAGYAGCPGDAGCARYVGYAGCARCPGYARYPGYPGYAGYARYPGYNTWWNVPFTTGSNPNRPTIDSENMIRVLGGQPTPAPLHPEYGDIWPGRTQPTPTLQQLEQSGSLTPEPQQPSLGSPLSRGTAPNQPPALPPQGTTGSSTPPLSNQAGVVRPPRVRRPGTPSAPPAIAREPGGQIVNTPTGTGVTTGGGAGYQTMTLPGGGTAIVVPNGNGTSTVIKPDGTIQTIPTPK